jgi:tRNA(fMet)-specific endonuclease VapC
MGEIGVCSVVAAELAYGVVKSGSSRNRQALEMFLAPLIILPFDEAAIWAYGELRAELERRGTPIGSLDTMIAAHAISQQAPLVTNNTREFARVPGLRLENWVPAA